MLFGPVSTESKSDDYLACFCFNPVMNWFKYVRKACLAFKAVAEF
jgi:hypothetical protein